MTPLLISLALAAAPVPKDDKADREFREKVDAARDKAVKYLKEKQGRDGSWESVTANLAGLNGGTTALAALALLEAGTDPKDPAVANAVDYLLGLKLDKTYVISLQTQVLARVDAKKHAQLIQANADWLMGKAIIKEKKLRGWSYPAGEITDNSNTHFAIMGLHAAAQAGAKVDADIWQQIRDYYAATQKKDGGWQYTGTDVGAAPSTQSMTLAGLLGLTIAVKYDKKAKGPDAAFEKGMKALLTENFGDGKSVGYDLFTTAELGRALGTTEFKSDKLGKAWYREGVEKLVKNQQPDGSFKAGERGIDANMPVISTAAGLYFLGPPAPAKK
jgi:hypothetical protein